MTDYTIELADDEAPVLACIDCGTVVQRYPGIENATAYCESCRSRTEHALDARYKTPEEAAATLVVAELERFGVVAHASHVGNRVDCWVIDSGVNLSNLMADWDIHVHEVGPVEAYKHTLEETAPADAAAYFNALVHGVRDDPEGATLPVYTHRRDGVQAADVDGLDDVTIRLCEMAGVPIPDGG